MPKSTINRSSILGKATKNFRNNIQWIKLLAELLWDSLNGYIMAIFIRIEVSVKTQNT